MIGCEAHILWSSGFRQWAERSRFTTPSAFPSLYKATVILSFFLHALSFFGSLLAFRQAGAVIWVLITSYLNRDTSC